MTGHPVSVPRIAGSAVARGRGTSGRGTLEATMRRIWRFLYDRPALALVPLAVLIMFHG